MDGAPIAVSLPVLAGGRDERDAAYWRREAIEARSRAGALAGIHRANKDKLEEAREELAAVRREAKASLDAVVEAARLRRLLQRLSVDPRRRGQQPGRPGLKSHRRPQFRYTEKGPDRRIAGSPDRRIAN